MLLLKQSSEGMLHAGVNKGPSAVLLLENIPAAELDHPEVVMSTLLRQVATFMKFTFLPGPPGAAAAEFQEARTAKRVSGPVTHAIILIATDALELIGFCAGHMCQVCAKHPFMRTAKFLGQFANSFVWQSLSKCCASIACSLQSMLSNVTVCSA